MGLKMTNKGHIYEIEDLPCSQEVKGLFLRLLADLDIERIYRKVFTKINEPYYVEQGCWFLSSYDKQSFLQQNPFYEIAEELNLNVSDQLLPSLVDELIKMDFLKFTEEHPDISFNIIEMLYFDKEKFTACIRYANAEKRMVQVGNQSKVLELIIYNLYFLLEKYPLIPFDLKVLKGLLPKVDSLTEEEQLVLAKKVIYFYKNLHELRGTRLCILDTESTGIGKPLPVQIAYLFTDMNFNIIEAKSYYIQQESIDKGAENVHGIGVANLHNELEAGMPEEVYSQITQDLLNKRLIFIMHNASFDERVLKNYSVQCGHKDFENMTTFCTYYNHSLYLRDKLDSYKLESIKNHFQIEDHEIQKIVDDNLKDPTNHTRNHDAVFDIATLYTILKKSRFLGRKI